MASAALVITVAFSPDLDAIVRYLNEAVERAQICNRLDDPRLAGLFRGIVIASATRSAELYFQDYRDGRLTLEPGDLLLDFAAKIRALERVMYAQPP